MKKLLFIVAIAAISTSVFSQKKAKSSNGMITGSIGLEAALPIGDFGQFYSFGIGGSVQGEYMASQNLGITLNGGYLSYSIKSKYGSGSSGFIPVMAGFKYYITNGPFIHAQIGAAFNTAGGGTSLAYAAGLGYNFTKSIDAELKYQAYSKNSFTDGAVGLRIAYNFGK